MTAFNDLFYYYGLDADGDYNYIDSATAGSDQYANSKWTDDTADATNDMESTTVASDAECATLCDQYDECVGFSYLGTKCKLLAGCRGASKKNQNDLIKLRKSFNGADGRVTNIATVVGGGICQNNDWTIYGPDDLGWAGQ